MDLDRRSVVGLGLGASLAVAGGARAAEAMASPAIADIDAYAKAHVAAHRLPGLTLALVGPRGAVSVLHYGLADVDRRVPVADDQLFQIGSISKSFTALCVFRLMEAGRLRLEDEVRRILPEIPLPADGRITVQSLLNHSSGLADDPPPFPRGGDQRLWQGFPVGTQWSYSNLGYDLLGTIVARLDGRPFGEALRALVLEPLGMAAARPAIVTAERARYAQGYSPFFAGRAYPRGGPLGPGAWTEMVAGSGCVGSTARDMATYMRWLIGAGQGHGAPLLSDAGALRFCSATIDAPGWAVAGSKYANGLALTPVEGRLLLHHTGGMLLFNSAVHVDPVAGVGAFASTNVGLIPYRPRGLTAYACARLRAEVDRTAAKPPPPVVAPQADLTEFHGRYAAQDGRTLAVGPAPRGMAAAIGGRTVDMEPGETDAFIALDPAATAHPLVFRRTAKAVVRAWWGETEYVRLEAGRPLAPFTPPPSPALASLAGHYESDDPWRGGFRVTVQGDRLFLDGTTPAAPLPGGGFRVGEKDWSPERLAFDAFVDGRPRRATLSGADYMRRAT
ncbi:MAG: serine hydrolase [Phenylobacterium sp.]